MAAVAPHEPITLRISRRYALTREKVFLAWTEPQALKKWMAPSDAHQIPVAEVDLRVGGRFRIVMQDPAGEQHRVGGVYREVSPPSRLVFTWAWESTPERESLVTVELYDRHGETELLLTHERFADDDARARHLQGWNNCLDRLGRATL
jgi:uncharacterized protein YndB with AHSA1/START domain